MSRPVVFMKAVVFVWVVLTDSYIMQFFRAQRMWRSIGISYAQTQMGRLNPNTHIAIQEDIYSNSFALDAVLQDIQNYGGVDEYWLLGVYDAIGFDPISVVERVKNLPAAPCLRGNIDRYLVDQSLPAPSSQDGQTNPKFLPTYIQVARSFAWTTSAVSTAGWLPSKTS